MLVPAILQVIFVRECNLNIHALFIPYDGERDGVADSRLVKLVAKLVVVGDAVSVIAGDDVARLKARLLRRGVLGNLHNHNARIGAVLRCVTLRKIR